ncbi:hypothetical protein HZA56_08995, partial [Candidatus Poribacteria bacterium]|nr:hypothetical protein [Candidatus Poribacteria bacterium]
TLSLGIPSYTFESFFSPLDYRVGAHIAGAEGAILAFVGTIPPKESFRLVKAMSLPRKSNFFRKSAKEAMALLGEDCRMMTRRPDKLFSRDRLVAWKAGRKIEFRRKWFRAISVWESY